MLRIAEYRRRADRLADHLPWAALVADGIVLNKGQTDFTQAVQGAVQSLMGDGTYLQILDKYGVANGAIPSAEINPTS